MKTQLYPRLSTVSPTFVYSNSINTTRMFNPRVPKQKRYLLSFCSALTMFLFFSLTSFAQTTYYWRGAVTSGNWSASANWSTVSSSSATNTGTFPTTASDVAIFDASSGNPSISLTTNISISNISFTSSNVSFTAPFTQTTTTSGVTSGSGTITLSSSNANIAIGQPVTLSGTNAGTLAANTFVTGISGTTLTVSPVATGTSTAAGTLTFGSCSITTTSMTVSSSQVTFTDAVTVNSSLTFSGTNPRITQNSYTSGRAFTLGNGNNPFTLTGNSATNYFDGNTNAYFGYNTSSSLSVFFNPSTITLGGISVTRGLITMANNVNTARLIFNGGNNSQELILGTNVTMNLTSGGSSNLTNNNTTTTGGTVNASATGSRFIISGNNATIASATNRIFKSGTPINHLEYNSTGNTLTLAWPLTVNNLTLTAGTISNSTNNITINNGGVITRAAGSLAAAPIFGANASERIDVTYTMTAATTAGFELPAAPSPGGIGNVSLNGPSGTRNLTLNNDVTINGNLSVSASNTLLLSTFTLNLAGSFTNSGTLTANTGTFNYNGTGSQTITAANYYNLTISGARSSNNVTLASSGTIGVSNILSYTATYSSGGLVNTGSTIDFNGTGAQTIPALNYNNLTISGARTTNSVTLASSGTIGVAGTLSYTATYAGGGLINTGSTIDYNGTGAQTVLSTVAYNNLTISGARTSNNVTLASSGTIAVAGNLSYTASFTSGSLVNTSSTVSLSGSGTQTVTTSSTLALRTFTISNASVTFASGSSISTAGLFTVAANFTQPVNTTIAASAGITVNNGVTYTIDASGLTGVASSTANSSNAVLNITGGTVTFTGTGNINVKGYLSNTNSTALSSATSSNLAFAANAAYQHALNGGTIPAASWNANSFTIITGVTSSVTAGISGQTFGNLIWNCTGQTSLITLFTSNSTLTVTNMFNIRSTNGQQLRIVSNSGITATTSVGSLIIDTTGNQTASYLSVGNNSAVNNITINGNVYIGNTATLNSGATCTLNVKGNWTNNGTFSGNSTTTVDFNGTGAQTISGNTSFTILTISNAATTIASGTSITATGLLTVAANFTQPVNTTVNSSAGFTVNTGVTYTVNASGLSAPASNTANSNNAVLNITAGTVTLTGTGKIDVYGCLNSATTTAYSGASTSNLQLRQYAVYQHSGTTGTIPSATWDANSNLYITGSTSGLTIGGNQAFGNIIFNCTGLTTNVALNASSGNDGNTIAGQLAVINTGTTGTFRMYNGGNTLSTVVPNGIQVGGSYSFNGTLTSSRAVFDLGANISGSSTTTTNVTVASNGTLQTTSSSTLNISGALSLTGTFTSTNIGINFNGTGAQTIPALNYNSLTISGARTSNNITLASSGTIGIAGTFTYSATFTSGGIVNTGSTVDFNGTGAQTVPAFSYNNLTISGSRSGSSVTLVNGGTISIAGNYNRTATFTTGSVSVTNNTVVFNGAADQSITVPASATANFNNLQINNTKSGGGVITLNNPVAVAGTLTLTSGRVLSSSTNTISVTNTSTSAISAVGTTASYIDGPLTRTFATTNNNTYTFPVGNYAASADNYYPLSVTTRATAAASFTVTVTATKGNAGGTAGTTVGTLSTSEYWTVQSSATNSLSFGVTTADIGSNSIIANTSGLANGTYGTLGGSLSGNSISGSNTLVAVGATDYYFVTGTPGAFYWVGGSSNNWDDANNWSSSSGGAGGNAGSAPLSGTAVYFDANSAAFSSIALGSAVSLSSLNFDNCNAAITSGAFTITTSAMNVTSSTVTFSSNVTVNSSLTFSGSSVINYQSTANTNSFTLGTGGSFTLTGSSATAYFDGNGNAKYTANYTGNNTFFFNPSNTIWGVTVTRGTLTIGNGLTIASLGMSATTNAPLLALATNATLTLGGNNSSSISSVISTSGGASIDASATGCTVTITSNNASILNTSGFIFRANTTINSLNLATTLGSSIFIPNQALTVRNLTLTSGTYNNSTNNVTILNGGTLTRVAGSLSAAPAFGTQSTDLIDVVYTNTGSITAGNELPTSPAPGKINNLSLNTSGTNTLTLANDITVNGNLSIAASKTLSASTYTINLAGNWVNNGTFTTGTSTVNFNGTTTISGSSTTTFNNVTIASSSSLTSPASGTINVAGNWTNNGTFTNNSGTVTFITASTGRSISGNATGSSQFNNVTFSSGGTWTTLPSNMTVAGNFNVSNGTVTAPSGTLTVGGNFSASSTTFIHNSGTVNFNGTTTLSGAINFNNVTITGTLTGITSTFSVAGNWVNNGTYNANNGTVNFNGTSTISGSTVTAFNNVAIATASTLSGPASGTMRIAGTFTLTGSFTHNSSTVDFNGTGAQTIPAASYYNLTISGTRTGNVTLVSGGTINIAGDYSRTATFTSGSMVVTNNTINMNGSAEQTISGSSALTFNNLTVSNTASTVSTANDITVSGVLNIASGADLDLQTNRISTLGTTSGTGTLFTQNTTSTPLPASETYAFLVNYNNATGSQTVVSGTYSNGLTLSHTSGTDTASANFTVSGLLTIQNAGASFDIKLYNLTDGGSFAGSAGNGTLLAGGNSAGGYQIPNNKTWTGTVRFNGTGGYGNHRIPWGTYNNLDVDNGNAGTMSWGINASDAGTYVINGTLSCVSTSFSVQQSTFRFAGTAQSIPASIRFFNLELGTGTTFPNGTVSIAGSFTPGTVTSASQGTIDFNGTTAQTIPAFNYNNLTISGARTTNSVTLASSGTIGVAGTLSSTATYSSGSLINTGSTVNFNGSGSQSVPAFSFNHLNISGGTRNVTLASGTINIAGNYSRSSTVTIFTNSGTVNLNGTTANQTLSVSGGSGTLTFFNLIVNNTNGGSGTITLNNATTVGTSLTLTKGKIDLGANNFTVNSSASIVGANSTSYILTSGAGRLVRNVVTAAATTFPVGTASSYAPITLTNATGNRNVTVGVSGTLSPAAFDANTLVNLQWSILASGSGTADVSYQFNTADRAGSYTTSGSQLFINASGTNSFANVSSVTGSNPFVAAISGVSLPTSTASLFVIGNANSYYLTGSIWNGTVWSPSEPTSSTDAIIAGNLTNSGTLTTKNLTINNGFTITNTGTISVAGTSFVNNGTIAGTGVLSLSGSSAQSVSGTGTLSNVTLNNSNGATFASGMQGVSGILTISSGTLNANGNLTLKSTASGSATIAQISSGNITGNVVVERYIPRGKRAFRDLAPSVSGAGSIFANWQEGGAFTAGYGTYITGIAAAKTFLEAKSATGFVDATTGLDLTASGSKSVFTYNNTSGSWNAALSNSKDTALVATRGYRVLVRGDRNWSMYLIPQADSMINATTLRATGTLLTGTQSITGLNTTANGFSLVGNPYVSVIDWLTLSKSNLNTTMWILSPRTRGYVTVNGSGVVVPSAGGHNIDQYIQPGQAFFVQTTANGAASLGIAESHKVSAANIKSVFDVSENNANNILRIGLYKPVASVTTSMVDEAAVLFGNYSNAVNGDDSYKMENSADNIALLNSGNKLAIEARSAASANDVLPVSLNKLSNGTNYQLKVDASGYNSNGFDVYVKDAYKQTETAVKAGSETVVDFTIDNAVSASFNNRFSLVFKPSVLPISSIDVQGVQQGSDVVLSINTVGESNIGTYTVEKSTDGVGYSAIATVAAKNTATASYSVTDSKAVSGNNYYRVKVNGLNEASTYSKVVVVKVGGSAAKYALYPNPSNGSQVGVQLTGVSAGKYTVTLRNMLGQEVHRAVVAHVGGNGQLSIKLASKLSSGSYTVSVLGATATPLYQGKLVVE